MYDPSLDEILVEIVESWRVRFRCLTCENVFTEYPPFTLPHKRFVKQDVLAKADKYLATDRATYRATIWERHVPLSYAEDHEGRQFSHSTVWRWLSWLGSLTDLLQKATQLILEKDPHADLHWKNYPIATHRVRSERRRQTLEQAARFLGMVDLFPRLFGVSLFTHLGTTGAVR